MVPHRQSGSSSTIPDRRIYDYYCKESFPQVHYLATVDGKRRAASSEPRPKLSRILQENISGNKGSHDCVIIHEMTSFHG